MIMTRMMAVELMVRMMVMVMKRTIVMLMKRVMGKKAFEQQEGREGAEAVITFQTSSSP